MCVYICIYKALTAGSLLCVYPQSKKPIPDQQKFRHGHAEDDKCVWVFSGEAGNAARMMLILNMVQGSFMATIAEGLTLAQATGQSQQTFLDILCQGQMASTFVDQKCQSKSCVYLMTDCILFTCCLLLIVLISSCSSFSLILSSFEFVNKLVI